MNGFEAIEFLKQNKYDVVLLDHMMPEMDGIETLHRVKLISDCINQDTPYIALTANAIAGVREMYLAEGFNDYLSKPVDAVQLEEMLAKYIPDEKITYMKNDPKNFVIETIDEPEDVTEIDYENLIDRQTGITNCGGMEKLYNKIINMFCNMYEEKSNQLNTFFSEKDWQNYIVNIHALKSNAYNIGCKQLGDKCLELELASKNVAAEKDVEKEIAFIENNHEKTMNFFKDVKKYIEKNIIQNS